MIIDYACYNLSAVNYFDINRAGDNGISIYQIGFAVHCD